MIEPGSSGPEFPQSTDSRSHEMVDSGDALFALAPVEKPTLGPIVPLVPPEDAPEPRRSQAWDDIGNHDGPFVAPDDEGQVFAVESQTPNRITGRAVRQIHTARKFGLSGVADRTPEQEANVQLAVKQGHDRRESERIAGGMSPEQARALRMVEALQRGKNPEDLAL